MAEDIFDTKKQSYSISYSCLELLPGHHVSNSSSLLGGIDDLGCIVEVKAWEEISLPLIGEFTA